MAPFRREAQGFHEQPLPKLRPAVHDVIGRRLRLHCEDLLRQPLPVRLLRLLAKLEMTAAKEPAPGGDEISPDETPPEHK